MRARAASTLTVAAVAACFHGDATEGLPCSDDSSCAGGLRCVDGLCGGSTSSGASRPTAVVLFVVDTSAEAAAVQGALGRSGLAFTSHLSGLTAFKIGFVSADLGNPWCAPAGARAALEGVLCRERLDDFVGSGGDLTADACLAACPEYLAEAGLEPTIVTPWGPAAPRPWVQGGKSANPNAPHDPDYARHPEDAFACLAPQPVDGCPFGQPLEAMRVAIRRSLDPEDPAFGFLSAGDLLTVVFVTAGHDCSYRLEHAVIFDPAGERALWSDPEAAAPTPELCWNAGAECSNPEGGVYFECHAVDRGRDGGPAATADDAVLVPVAEYVDFLGEELGEELGVEVMIAGLVGVPEAFAGGGAAIPYALGDGGEGIGLGCAGAAVEAAPPLRLRALAEAFSGASLRFSTICAGDYGAALDELGAAIVDEVGRIVAAREAASP